MIAKAEIDASPSGAFSPREHGGAVPVPTRWQFLRRPFWSRNFPQFSPLLIFAVYFQNLDFQGEYFLVFLSESSRGCPCSDKPSRSPASGLAPRNAPYDRSGFPRKHIDCQRNTTYCCFMLSPQKRLTCTIIWFNLIRPVILMMVLYAAGLFDAADYTSGSRWLANLRGYRPLRMNEGWVGLRNPSLGVPRRPNSLRRQDRPPIAMVHSSPSSSIQVAPALLF